MLKNTPLYLLIAIFIGCITQVQAQTCTGSLTITLTGSTSGSATAAPTGTASQTFCAGATVADLVATGTTIKWYAAASGGSALATTTVLTTATHYYATQTLVNSATNCESVLRLDVTVIVTPKQTIALSSASGTNTQTVCATTAMTNITYTITNQASVTMSPNLLVGAVSGLSATFSSGTLTISGTPTATVNYTVTVLGGTSCTDVTATGSVTANPAILAGSCTDATDVCQLSAGQIRIEVSGGTAPYTLTANGKTVPNSPVLGTISPVTAPTGTVSGVVTSYLFTGLAGNVEYKFRIQDNKGCVVGVLH